MREPLSPDVAIIGAGPAGLSAAALLGERGVRTVVVDEYPVPGGRLPGQSYRSPKGAFDGPAVARDLLLSLEGRPITLMTGVTVSHVREDPEGWRLHLSAPPGLLRARACLIATGATEIPIPIPGWTLPGVLTVGAAQILGVVWGVPLGRRGVVVGATPLAFAIADELQRTGTTLFGIVMPPEGPATAHLGGVEAQWGRLGDWRRLAPWWARPGAALMGTDLGRRLLMPVFPKGGVPVTGCPVMLATGMVEILGTRTVEAVRLQRLDGEGHGVGRPFEEAVDFVLLAGGLRPLPDLLQAAGAEMVRLEALGGTVPLTDEGGATTRPGLFAAGNATGIEGAPIAIAQGRLAALAITRHLEGDEAVTDATWQAARRALAQSRRDAPLSFHPGADAARIEIARRWALRKEAN